VRPCVRPETLLTRYLAEYLTHFHRTYNDDALWNRDERFTIWGQKVKGQGHGGIKYDGNSTLFQQIHSSVAIVNLFKIALVLGVFVFVVCYLYVNKEVSK